MVIMGIFSPVLLKKVYSVYFYLYMHFDFLQVNQLVKNSNIKLIHKISYICVILLENESKCNNVTFGTQNPPFNMCCYSISVIF